MTTREAFFAEAGEAAALWGAQVNRLILARENAVFEITMPGGGRAALRLHRQGYQAQAAIRSELWWCAELAAAGLPVPAPIRTPTGDLLATLSSGQDVSVVGWRRGVALGSAGTALAQPVEVQVALHHRLGQLLRRLHNTSDALVLPKGFLRPNWDAAGLVGEAPFWGRFWEHPKATPEQRSVLITARDVLRAELSRLQREEGAICLIHADVLRENVLVDGDDLSLIDFDDSGFGFRLYDLGTVLSQNQYEPARDALRGALMDGYGARDTDLVELFTMARTLASVGWTMPRLAGDDPIHLSHLQRAVTCARRVLG